MLIRVFITIDVETSIGGAFARPDELKPVGAEKRIYGRIGSKEYGIPLVMDILEQYNLKGTFFVEPFCSFYFGEEMVRSVCQYILNRGHDVQLHLHPNYQIFQYPDWQERAKRKKLFPDIIAKYPLKEQINLIKKGKKILEGCGVNPIAFRAGNFGANLATLEALKQNGFLFDSSYDALNLGKICFLYQLPITNHQSPVPILNDLTLINGICEFPITNYYEFKIGNFKKLRHLDICAVSFLEMKQVLKQAFKKGPKHVTFILHSFSFIKKKDVQYKTAKPNFIIIKRFKKLCEFLNKNTNLFKVTTFSEFAQSLSPNKPYEFNKHYRLSTRDYELEINNHIPFVSVFPTLLRYVSQAIQYL